MTTEEFLTERSALLEKKKQQLQAINEEYSSIVFKYIEDNCSIQRDKVYTVTFDPPRKTKFKRFVVYSRNVMVFEDLVTIDISGWWLNNKNIPTTWQTHTVEGVSNPTVLTISDDQTNLPHPEANKMADGAKVPEYIHPALKDTLTDKI